MTDQLPDPLVPAEVDLRGYEFMPLFGDRLFGSETWIGVSSEAKLGALRLWWRAYAKEVPAASLPDNDALLADYAGYGAQVKPWRRVKPQAMRGFVLCSDGRWYHPFVAELALDAWKGRRQHQLRTLKARIAALEKRLKEAGTDDEKAHIECLLQGLRDDLSQAMRGSVTGVSNRPSNTVPKERTGTGTGQDKETTAAAPPGQQPAELVTTLDSDPIFGPYLRMLEGKGMANGHARAFVSLMRQGYGDELVLTVLDEAKRQDVTKPLPWIKKALETRAARRRGNGAANRQEEIEARNRKAVQDWQPPEVRDAAR